MTRFSLLYNVALQTCADNQEQVDLKVLLIEPSTSRKKSPHTKRLETIYTRLRNELAHDRQKPLDSTIKEIKTNLGAFQNIVRRMVADYL